MIIYVCNVQIQINVPNVFQVTMSKMAFVFNVIHNVSLVMGIKIMIARLVIKIVFSLKRPVVH